MIGSVEKSGNLPTKQTTRHVGSPDRPPGEIDSKGRMKFIDKVTGKVRWIDRKKGVVLDDNGNPVH